MPTTVVRIYDKLSVAEQARDQLLNSGFSADSVHLTSTLDEAGPVENNFILDEKDTGKGPRSGRLNKMFGVEERTDAYGNASPEWRSSYLLTVDTDDDEQLERASDIMERMGAMDRDGHAASHNKAH